MTVTASKPAIILREMLARIVGLEQRIPPRLVQHTTSGDGSTTDFAMPKGFKPFMVFDAGSLTREGSGEDYTVSFDGFIYTVVFAVAPATGDVTMICEVQR